ncbi:MAG: ABC transporter permease [Cyclobacteriaceae bacterium]
MDELTRPPQWPDQILKWLLKDHYFEEVTGDLEEIFYDDLDTKGKRTARKNYQLGALKVLRPTLIKKIEGTQKLNYYGMFKNYFKVSIRNMMRYKTFSFLNISGLAVGIASCLLILTYVMHELSYDNFHEKEIYRVLHSYRSNEAAEEQPNVPLSDYQVWGNSMVGPTMINDYPEVTNYVRFTSPMDFLFQFKNNVFMEKNVVFGDSSMFEIFDFKVLAGDAQDALIKPYTIVLTESMAKKYFGNENPIGQEMIIDETDRLIVSAIVEDIPTNSHFNFDGMISMSTFHDFRPQIFESWGYVDFYTYFTVQEHANIGDMESRARDFLDKYISDWGGYSIKFEPMADAYLKSEAARPPGAIGSITSIYILSSVAIFILLIACINFMNLSTARAVERAKEVAIRKTIGSTRENLIFQFLIEAILVSIFSGILAIGFISISMPFLAALSGKPLTPDWMMSFEAVGLALASLMMLGLISGLYPAMVISQYKPVVVLKGAFKNSSRGVFLRKSLVVLQFSISIILLVGTIVVSSQLDHLKDHDLGFNPSNKIVIDFGWDMKVQRSLDRMRNEFYSLPAVKSIAISRAVPGHFFPNGGTEIEGPSGEMVAYAPAMYEINEDFIPVFEMEMAAGRNYSKDFPLDSANALIINEAAAKLYGYNDVNEIIGKPFDQWGRVGKVIGVVKDFNYQSLHNKIEPLALRYSTPQNTSMITMELNTSDYRSTLLDIESKWNQLYPHRPMVYKFIDRHFNTQYEEDQRFGQVFTIFSGLAVLVACLGLFGLTMYSITQRTKEIGIRKVMGASISQIVTILSYDFFKLFLGAVLLSVPLAWYLMDQWLADFAYQIDLTWTPFVLALLVSFVVAMLTISSRTIKAASCNPVDTLRNE